MASELYRTYEVLIEESVHPSHPKRGKSSKSDGYNSETHQALRTTNDLFQDAVCYYTIMLAGLAGDGVDGNGRALNPLWKEFTTGKHHQQTGALLKRLATRYRSCADTSTAFGFRSKFLFPDEFVHSAGEVEHAQMAADTYRVIEQQAVKTVEDGEIEEGEALNEFASSWASILADPENKTVVPGAGILDSMHRNLLNDPGQLESLLAAAFEKATQWCSEAAEHKQQERFREMEADKVRAVAAARTEPTRARKRAEWEAKIETEREKRSVADKEGRKNRENAVKTLRKAFADGLRYNDENKHGLSPAQFTAVEATLKAVGESITSATPGIHRVRYGSRDNSFEGVLLRYWWIHREETPHSTIKSEEIEAAKAAVRKDLEFYIEDAKQAPKEPPTLNGKPVTAPPFAATHKCAFPLFLKGVAGIDDGTRSPWWEFDKAAFMYAADDVFKYKRRTQERQARFNKLNCLVQKGEEADGICELKPEDSPTGKKLTVRGMKSDPRRGKMLAMLTALAEDRGLEGAYGLRPGTIGGWADVREAFLNLEASAKKQSRGLEEAELIDAVDDCQKANSQGFGSPDFFHALCDKNCHDIWSLAGQGSDEAKANEITDFVAYYVRFLEWKDEVMDLQDVDAAGKTKLNADGQPVLVPISYTFPGLMNRHGEVSQRHFNFKADLAESFTFEKLFTRGEGEGQLTYRLVAAEDQRKVKLAARRLKRDKIMTPGGQSVGALWCPPLVLGLEQQPKAGKKPKATEATKPLAVSFSLVVDVEQEKEVWRTVHLKVQLPVGFAELNKTLRSGKTDWGSSFEWNKDATGRFFRWPVDRVSKALATVSALRNHPAWENQSETIAEFLTQITPGTTNAQGRAQARRIDKAGSDVTDDRSKHAVAAAVNALKAIGERVWCEDKGLNPEILSIDLGNRFCAAFARLRVHRDQATEKRGRMISPDREWESPVFALEVDRGILRLQGEDAWVWDHARDAEGKCAKNSGGVYVYERVREQFGNHGRGRFPKPEELKRFEALADAILPISRMPIRALNTMTVPEMGDHLVWRLRRRISRIRNLFKMRWWAHPNSKKRDPNTGRYDQDFKAEERKGHKQAVLEMLARNYTRPKREEDEMEDAVNERLRLILIDKDTWEKKFGGVAADETPAVKGKSKSARKSKDVLRGICRDLFILPAKWPGFVAELEKEMEEMLAADKLDSVMAEWHAGAQEIEKAVVDWKALRQPLAAGTTAEGAFSYDFSSTSLLLCAVMEWCLPVQKRHWHWKADKAEPCLFMGKHGANDADCEDPRHEPPIRGMRGLALRRLEQVLNLRQLCQSFAKVERRWLQDGRGVNDLVIKRGDELHDPCPDLLKKSNELRDQRVFQTAHLILTEALGLELKNPAEVERDSKTKKELKNEIDLHGSYKPKPGRDGNPLPRCSVIVLEDLSRYRTSQERTKSENSRLMQWAHRKIIEKLADMAKPFGITLMLVDPAWSSRFDSRTGVAGIRVKEVRKGFEEEMPFAAWKTRVKASGTKDDLAMLVEETKKAFDDHPDFKSSLLIPIDGGELFLPAMPPAFGKDGVINADENAALNIGLRALAHPDRLDIFPRLRTVKKADGTVKVRNRRGYFASLPEEDAARGLRVDWSQPEGKVTAEKAWSATAPEDVDEAAAAESSEHPDYFAVVGGRTDFGVLCHEKRHFASDDTAAKLGPFAAYERPLFLKRVQDVCGARIRCINEDRLENRKDKWKSTDEDDQIPGL